MTKWKYFVVSDIHGCYDELKNALDEAGFDINNETHCLVTAGDMLDRGQQARKVLEFILSTPRHVFIIGNHEWNMELAISKGSWGWYDGSNGTIDTAYQLTGTYHAESALMLMSDCELYNEYIKQCYPYFEGNSVIVTHGWIPCSKVSAHCYDVKPNWRDCNQTEWIAASWVNGMEAWAGGARHEKTVICGHFNVQYGHFNIHNIPKSKLTYDIFADDGIVALDAWTPYTHHVNVYIFEDLPIKI